MKTFADKVRSRRASEWQVFLGQVRFGLIKYHKRGLQAPVLSYLVVEILLELLLLPLLDSELLICGQES